MIKGKERQKEVERGNRKVIGRGKLKEDGEEERKKINMRNFWREI